MNEETRRILEMVAQGKITVDEGAQLISAMEKPPSSERPKENEAPIPRFLRMDVLKSLDDGHIRRDVTIRIPVALVRSGIRLGAMFPRLMGDRITRKLRDEGIVFDLNRLNAEHIEALIRDMGEMTIDVEKGKAQVRFTCEA